ncbi:hypothetical protein IR128_11475 [Staphylococcus lentus]|uniref:hypothetical protein n=1 Tax=Mammaliicoccus TaxID=2803850 RepID=UPI001883CC18|nr:MULTISPECIES: hypothetical protein [Mammaliicoccus]MBF0842330.1 hypothetical protein [Mammaliicoccus lentus]
MITKIYDDKYSYEVGKDNVGIITQWRVNKDSVDIYRIADKDNNLIIFHGFTHKDYVVEHDDEPILGRQMSIFEI